MLIGCSKNGGDRKHSRVWRGLRATLHLVEEGRGVKARARLMSVSVLVLYKSLWIKVRFKQEPGSLGSALLWLDQTSRSMLDKIICPSIITRATLQLQENIVCNT